MAAGLAWGGAPPRGHYQQPAQGPQEDEAHHVPWQVCAPALQKEVIHGEIMLDSKHS